MSTFYYPSSSPSSSPPASPVASSSSSSSSGSDGEGGDDRSDGGGGSSHKRRRTSTGPASSQQPDEIEQPPEAVATCLWTDDMGNECGRTFGELTPFISHVHDDHIGNVRQAYVCEWSTCPRKGKTQTSRFALVSHFRSHSGEKPFHCPEAQCDKSFTRSDALAKHMRIQHSINPSNPARNVAQTHLGPTAKHPDREIPPDAPGGRNIPKGRETEAAREEAEWERLALPSSSAGVGSSGVGTFQSGSGLPKAAGEPKPEKPEYGSDEEGGSEYEDDEFTGGLLPAPGQEPDGRPRFKVRYLVGKALHREAMRERDELEAELEGCKRELKRSWEWKEQALDAVLRRHLGPDAEDLLIAQPAPPVAASTTGKATLSSPPSATPAKRLRAASDSMEGVEDSLLGA